MAPDSAETQRHQLISCQATRHIAGSAIITRLVTAGAVIRGDDEAPAVSYQSPGVWGLNPKPKYRSLKQI
jgi:hypothetical protein